jgi:hypothetical protein
MGEIDLFWFVDPSKLCFLQILRQTLHWGSAFPYLHEARPLSQLFLIEEPSIRILLHVISEPYGQKDYPDINFNQNLFEVVIDLEQECGGWLLLFKGAETSSMLLQGAK